jgi:hypothetical protein
LDDPDDRAEHVTAHRRGRPEFFVGSGISDLICIDKKDGKILWLQSSTPTTA